MDIAILVIGILSLFFSTTSLLLGAIAFIEVRAYKLSTHKVEYVPFNNTPMPDATSSEDIEKYNKQVINDRELDELAELY